MWIVKKSCQRETTRCDSVVLSQNHSANPRLKHLKAGAAATYLRGELEEMLGDTGRPEDVRHR